MSKYFIWNTAVLFRFKTGHVKLFVLENCEKQKVCTVPTELLKVHVMIRE